MRSQQRQDRFMVNQQQRHACGGNRIAFMLLQLAVMHLLLIQYQHQPQHFGVHGQITDPSTVQIGDMVCFEGYVMDYYCIDRGTLLDNPSVTTLEGPDQHSVHCLVDVEECFTSPFELLADPNTFNGTTSDDDDDATLYTRAFRVDDNGRSMLIELARSHGSCGTCTGSSESESTPIVKRGFRAEIYGTVVAVSSDSDNSGSGSDNSGSGSDDGRVPVQVQVTDAKRSNDQATICGVTKVAPAPAPTKVTDPAPTNGESDEESEITQQSNDTGITALSVIVVLMAAALAVMSLYFVVVGSPNASKSAV